MVSLTPGTLGSSAIDLPRPKWSERIRLYTLYYDAIEESLLCPGGSGGSPRGTGCDNRRRPSLISSDSPLTKPMMPSSVRTISSTVWGRGNRASTICWPVRNATRRLPEEATTGGPRMPSTTLFGDRRDSNSEEEQDEERTSRIARGQSGGSGGHEFLCLRARNEPLLELPVFGYQIGTFISG